MIWNHIQIIIPAMTHAPSTEAPHDAHDAVFAFTPHTRVARFIPFDEHGRRPVGPPRTVYCIPREGPRSENQAGVILDGIRFSLYCTLSDYMEPARFSQWILNSYCMPRKDVSGYKTQEYFRRHEILATPDRVDKATLDGLKAYQAWYPGAAASKALFGVHVEFLANGSLPESSMYPGLPPDYFLYQLVFFDHEIACAVANRLATPITQRYPGATYGDPAGEYKVIPALVGYGPTAPTKIHTYNTYTPEWRERTDENGNLVLDKNGAVERYCMQIAVPHPKAHPRIWPDDLLYRTLHRHTPWCFANELYYRNPDWEDDRVREETKDKPMGWSTNARGKRVAFTLRVPYARWQRCMRQTTRGLLLPSILPDKEINKRLLPGLIEYLYTTQHNQETALTKLFPLTKYFPNNGDGYSKGQVKNATFSDSHFLHTTLHSWVGPSAAALGTPIVRFSVKDVQIFREMELMDRRFTSWAPHRTLHTAREMFEQEASVIVAEAKAVSDERAAKRAAEEKELREAKARAKEESKARTRARQAARKKPRRLTKAEVAHYRLVHNNTTLYSFFKPSLKRALPMASETDRESDVHKVPRLDQ